SGDATAAVGHLEPAIDRLSELDSGSDELAPARFALAQALWRAPTPGDDARRRARGLAESAAATYEGQGEAAAARLAEVHAWLDAHTVTTTPATR
ncbi:MAG: hypothetical protein KC486_23780, partial [Myxococcales bacterium]|nr:hypothetical protein [Myxococcales bacterium]